MEKLDRLIRAYCEENKIYGVLRVTQREAVLYEARIGFAHHDKKTPFTEDSIFTFYSMSKPFCAMGFLKLVERGLVSLFDHPGRVLPEASGLHEKLTFYHLLHHVSGAPDFMLDQILPQDQAGESSREIRAQLPLLCDHPPIFAPGEGARYSNINFLLLALAVEELSGISYGDYMKQEVFAPLGMEDALVDRKGLFLPRRVSGHILNEEGLLIPVERQCSWMLGGGDVVGTLSDASALHRAVKNRLLLSRETWEKILTPHPLNGMGMGCSIKPWNGKRQVRHNGGHVGFRTLHILLPEDDFDILFLSNCGFGNARKDIAGMIYSHFYGAPASPDDTPMDTGYAV